jgi:DNA-directed RNA polymerase subunit RPC12/RpoP
LSTYLTRYRCETCHHTVDLDLEALGQPLGFDHSTMHDDLTPKLKCSRCGERKAGLILSAKTTHP